MHAGWMGCVAFAAACTQANVRECEDSSVCIAEAGGVCRVNAATGSQWCSFPDGDCPSGFRWGDAPVGDGLAGTCVDGAVDPPDAEIACTARISWLRGPIGQKEIWIANLDASGQVGLTTGSMNLLMPEWRAAGDKVAFARPNGGPAAIWVMSADGSDAEPISDGPDVTPHWSPDGTRIVFVRTSPSVQLQIVSATGGLPTTVPQPASTLDLAPSWSPDGQQIAFISNRDGDNEVWLVSSAGTGAHAITTSATVIGDFDNQPQWSPSGARIVYLAAAGNGDIWVINADGANPMRLTEGTTTDRTPRWLPDDRIVFARNAESIWRMDSDGSSPIEIVNDGTEVTVSHDGRLAFTSERDGNKEIYVSDADGSNQVRITNDSAEDDTPRWVGCP
jgi:Tol biopolymer transport system component